MMDGKGIYMFFSFDLAGSTKFKEEYPWLWSDFFASYYDASIQYIEQEGGGMRLWKMLGDELLIYKQIGRIEDIYAGLAMTQRVLESRAIIDAARDLCLEKIARRTEQPTQLDVTAKIIDEHIACKATVWVAPCNPEAEGGDNIYYDRWVSKEWRMWDFLGHEIDEGFHIAKFARRGRILVSPMLAWLAWRGAGQDTERRRAYEDALRIVSYTRLKGLWEERKYPLVMYWDSFEDLHRELEYDEMDAELYGAMAGRKWEEYMADELYRVPEIERILANVGQLVKAEAMLGELTKG